MPASQTPPQGSFGSAKSRSIEEIAREQGVTVPQDLSKLIGAGADLWDSDEELDEFLRGIDMRKKENLPHLGGSTCEPASTTDRGG
jgi:hypothetical protein